MQRRIPAAGGLVIVYVALLQARLLLPTLLANGLELLTEPVAIGTLVTTCGLVALGFAIATERAVRVATGVWLAGGVIAVAGLLRIHTNGLGLVVALVQFAGGPLVLTLVARAVPPSRASARREIGASLLVIGIGGMVTGVWEFISELHMFGGHLPTSSLLGLAVSPLVMILTGALAVRAAHSFLYGRATAQRVLAQWMWVVVGAHGSFVVLQLASLYGGTHEVARPLAVQLVLTAAISSVMPVVLAYLGRCALALPIDPRDSRTVPTVYAWVAAWSVPILASAAILVQTSFAAGLLPEDPARFGLVSASCIIAAIVLLATAISVLRAASIARLLVKVTAALSLCALCYVGYLGWTMGGPHEYSRLAVPVGAVALFTTIMFALAAFEARREHDLAPARVIE